MRIVTKEVLLTYGNDNNKKELSDFFDSIEEPVQEGEFKIFIGTDILRRLYIYAVTYTPSYVYNTRVIHFQYPRGYEDEYFNTDVMKTEYGWDFFVPYLIKFVGKWMQRYDDMLQLAKQNYSLHRYAIYRQYIDIEDCRGDIDKLNIYMNEKRQELADILGNPFGYCVIEFS